MFAKSTKIYVFCKNFFVAIKKIIPLRRISATEHRSKSQTAFFLLQIAALHSNLHSLLYLFQTFSWVCAHVFMNQMCIIPAIHCIRLPCFVQKEYCWGKWVWFNGPSMHPSVPDLLSLQAYTFFSLSPTLYWRHNIYIPALLEAPRKPLITSTPSSSPHWDDPTRESENAASGFLHSGLEMKALVSVRRCGADMRP